MKKMKIVAIIAGAIWMTSLLALAALPSASPDASASVLLNGHHTTGSFEIAQRPPRHRAPNNGGWGDIDPYSFGGWEDGANTG